MQLRAGPSVMTFDGDAGGHDGCQYEVEGHVSPPSNAITIDRVPDRQGEEAEPQSYQRGIQHCLLLAVNVRRTERRRFRDRWRTLADVVVEKPAAERGRDIKML